LANRGTPRIAVVVHLYYLDLWPELAALIANVPRPFRLFVTVPEGSTAGPAILEDFADADIREVPNRGRDIAPFLSLYPELSAFDLVCKVHAKREAPLHREWRIECLRGVLGSPAIVGSILEAFDNHADMLIAGSRDLYLDGPRHAGTNADLMRVLYPDLPGAYGFFGGSMLWLRPSVFADFATAFPPDCFVPHDATGGQPEHAVERLFGVRTAAMGGKVGLVQTGGVGPLVEVAETHKTSPHRFAWIYKNLLPDRYAAFQRAWYARTPPSIALVIPFYNGSKFLPDAVRSALEQSVPFSAIIVVDDGSRPKGAAFVAKFARRHNLHLIRQPNSGQGGARNRGIEAAGTDWVCFLDQDDVLLPEHNAVLIEEAAKLPAAGGWVFANYSRTNAKGRVIKPSAYPHATEPVPQALADFLTHNLNMLPSASIYSRKALLAVGGFDASFRGFEDDDLHVRLFLAGYECRRTLREVYQWRSHQGQTSRSPVMRMSAMRFMEKWAAHAGEGGRRSDVDQALYARWRKELMRFTASPDRATRRRARLSVSRLHGHLGHLASVADRFELITRSWLPLGLLRDRPAGNTNKKRRHGAASGNKHLQADQRE
jgi:hypothetical protein